MYQNLVCSADAAAPDSVHLAGFPVADMSAVDDRLSDDTRLVMKVSSLGRAARSKAGITYRKVGLLVAWVACMKRSCISGE